MSLPFSSVPLALHHRTKFKHLTAKALNNCPWLPLHLYTHLKLYISASAKLSETTAHGAHTLCHFNPLCFFCSCGPYLPVFPSPNTCASLSPRLGVHPPESLTCLRKEETGPPWGYYLWMFRFSLPELYNHQFICLYYLCIFLLPSYYIVTSFLGILPYYLCIIISCPHPEGRWCSFVLFASYLSFYPQNLA